MKVHRIQLVVLLILTILVARENPSYAQSRADWLPPFRAAAKALKNAPKGTDKESCLYRAVAWIDISSSMAQMNNLKAQYKGGAEFDLSLEGLLGGGDSWALWVADWFTPHGLAVAVGNFVGNQLNSSVPEIEKEYKNSKGETVSVSLNEAAEFLKLRGGLFHKTFCCTCVDALKDTTIHDMHCRDSKAGAWSPPNGDYYKQYCESSSSAGITQVSSGE